MAYSHCHVEAEVDRVAIYLSYLTQLWTPWDYLAADCFKG